VSESALDPVACAAFVVVAFALAGCAQAAWLSSSISRPLAWPLDCGATLRGRRVLGPNKTVRGFVVMVPATSLAFVLVSLADPAGVWQLPTSHYGLLGAVAGAGFMAAELPNSFLKRQLQVAPGAAAHGRVSRPLFAVVDHIDSVCGAVGAMALLVTVPRWTVVCLLPVGWIVHRVFSALTFHVGGKVRAA
jgi:CDP-2,3-bis-(O-geranylgeranyl)-sn-glycerol synthase